MLKKLALLFGIVFLAVGVLGFVPAAMPGGLLFGLFHVNLLHNLVHLAFGVFGVCVGWGQCPEVCAKWCTPQFYFRVVGVIYAVLAILGFIHGNEPILGVIASNHAGTVLHSVIAVVSLYLGFVHKE